MSVLLVVKDARSFEGLLLTSRLAMRTFSCGPKRFDNYVTGFDAVLFFGPRWWLALVMHFMKTVP